MKERPLELGADAPAERPRDEIARRPSRTRVILAGVAVLLLSSLWLSVHEYTRALSRVGARPQPRDHR